MMKFGPAVAGMHVTGLFQDAGIADRAVAATCTTRGVAVDPLSKYGATDRSGLVFGFAGASRDKTRECLKVVRRAITDQTG
jgi:GntR family transcriptional regulator / MocR family aminotransferase